ncbi:hypothetical protein Fcan01_13692 [Folsomia candida]|uniref:Uncharacterized protein n=1 Tax=Folsomia candida TaxID=158441 RepID=A0A226E0V3_FOLCA|nr:hypothetical protein Fcan01_13692 [Folsomia candida]
MRGRRAGKNERSLLEFSCQSAANIVINQSSSFVVLRVELRKFGNNLFLPYFLSLPTSGPPPLSVSIDQGTDFLGCVEQNVNHTLLPFYPPPQEEERWVPVVERRSKTLEPRTKQPRPLRKCSVLNVEDVIMTGPPVRTKTRPLRTINAAETT